MEMKIKELVESNPILKKIADKEELLWLNPMMTDAKTGIDECELTMDDINDAEARLKRFAPFIMKCFPETKDKGGIIESELVEIKAMRERLNEKYGSGIEGRLLLKKDSHLAVAGSIKARGGIYEVLKHAESLALEAGIIKITDDYSKLAELEAREFFSKYTMQVASTGNLGLSIGITSAAIGFEVIVHMSADAKQWKKDLLRSKGCKVVEYATDYSAAVIEGRNLSNANPMSYFVDDENSKNLFLGYAVAAKRIVSQLEDNDIVVDENHPLFVYLPCGVGGAPGGVAFGMKHMFGDNVHCFFVEPVEAPCMVLGMESGLNDKICVQDIGLSGQTEADGLAVGRASAFVGEVMKPFLSGEFTMEDAKLYEFMRDLLDTEDVFIEPSSCSSFMGPACLCILEEGRKYIEENGLADKMKNAAHIAWATGGSLVPDYQIEEYRNTYL